MPAKEPSGFISRRVNGSSHWPDVRPVTGPPTNSVSLVPCTWKRTCSRSLRSIGGGPSGVVVEARRMPSASMIERRLMTSLAIFDFIRMV